jgi:hypothetical protein
MDHLVAMEWSNPEAISLWAKMVDSMGFPMVFCWLKRGF